MTTDGDPRQQARLGLFLTVSLLLHAVAVPFMQTGTMSAGHSGDGLQVTLVGAARENPGGATASDRAPARSDDAPTRQRTTQRRREPQVEATTTVAPSAEPTTPASVQRRKPETTAPPAALTARTEPARSPDEPTPEPVTTARVESSEPEASTAVRVEDTEPRASTPPATVVADTEPAPSPDEPTPEPVTTARVENPEPEPETIQPPTREQSQAAASDSETPEPTQSPATATMATATAPGTLAGVAGATAGSLDAGGDRTLLALLHHAIDNRKRYPKLARRQRREGSATVLFRLHPDGALDRLELAASSGFDLLDRAALRAVADVAPFAPATRYLTRDKQFSVEVEFRLF